MILDLENNVFPTDKSDEISVRVDFDSRTWDELGLKMKTEFADLKWGFLKGPSLAFDR